MKFYWRRSTGEILLEKFYWRNSHENSNFTGEVLLETLDQVVVLHEL